MNPPKEITVKISSDELRHRQQREAIRETAGAWIHQMREADKGREQELIRRSSDSAHKQFAPAFDPGYCRGMVDLKLQVPATEEVEADAETLAAIDRGIKAAAEGRTVPLEEVRKMIPKWISKFKSQTRR